MKRNFLSLIIFLLPIVSTNAQKDILRKLLEKNADQFGEVLTQPEQYDVQIIYTQIDRDENNVPHFTSYSYGLDPSKYYYPASSVKMPIAFLALEKINKLNIIGLDKYSTMITGAGHAPQTPASIDTTSATGLPSVANYVKKIFLVSDNDAYNRLYEFLGQEQLNQSLWQKGYSDASIVHRLEASNFGEEANRYTNPVYFYNEKHELLYQQGEVYGFSGHQFDLKKTLRGQGYFRNGELVEAPFDFSKKNYISLQDQHDLLKAVIFPEAVPPSERFDLNDDDYRFLYQVMSERPHESEHPFYDEPDHYVKFFIYGDQPAGKQMPDNVRIFNKVGWAYGFLSDISYVVDFDLGIEFFIAATIHVNANGIYNDDHYEYETIGLPFFSKLGKIIYEREKNRERKHRPDLQKFKISSYN